MKYEKIKDYKEKDSKAQQNKENYISKDVIPVCNNK